MNSIAQQKLKNQEQSSCKKSVTRYFKRCFIFFTFRFFPFSQIYTIPAQVFSLRFRTKKTTIRSVKMVFTDAWRNYLSSIEAWRAQFNHKKISKKQRQKIFKVRHGYCLHGNSNNSTYSSQQKEIIYLFR